ncbi:expressed unknown protein [Seminavis robusta]|uniref:Uncharacterized protein n=1 Tax=Seminavis robusta TaxID=568900 RepID=A0A9N8EUY8_9STRA|nr:expressed unknown protein [Seminavis robusta]|eukprot:Sro1758_g295740.1 n/a (154) ;mRNA; f:10399-10860
MATSKSLDALEKTRESLKEIKKQLLPFLRDLVGESSENAGESVSRPLTEDEKEKRAQASMAVALAMGTLRYMGARLRGLNKGRTADDPLRKELNNMRQLMVTLQKKLDETKEKKEAPKRKAVEEEKTVEATQKPTAEPTQKPEAKRRKTSKKK